MLDEVPAKWRPLFELLAATGLRISEAVGLRWSDLALEGDTPHLNVRRAIVKGAIVAPKSRHGARLIPLTPELATMLRAARARDAEDDAFVLLAAPVPRPIKAVCAVACSSLLPSAPA